MIEDKFDIGDNPFTVHSPDALDEVPAKHINNLFVRKHTSLSTIEQQKHTFLWGSRGSGKTFILRYMEPECQEINYDSMEEFIQEPDSYVAIYTPCKKGEIDKAELDLVSSAAASTIGEHLLNLTVAEEAVKTVQNQFPSGWVSNDKKIDFANHVEGLFDSASIAGAIESIQDDTCRDSEPLEWVSALFEEEKRRVSRFLQRFPFVEETRYSGATSGYHDFLLPFVKRLQELLEIKNTPIYILVDDAFHLREEQQKVVNTWVANRDQGTLCVKVSADQAQYETLETKSGGSIDVTHDYTEVDIDEIYTRGTGDYGRKVKEIAERRLELFDMPTTDIEDFLPKRDYEMDLLDEIKEEMAEEWKERGKPGNKSDYINRYAKARLHQRLAEGRNKKSYAGFENIVHISAGRVRHFLDPCAQMFDKVKDGGINPEEIEEIPPNIQDEVLNTHSQEFLTEEPEKIRKDISSEEEIYLDNLITLMKSLGKIFYTRLHQENHREPRIFSFTVRDEIPSDSDVGKTLEFGTRYNFLTHDTYSSKEGGGSEDWYILNRRLAPEFKIDPTGFQGRIRLNQNELEIGCDDPQEFERVVMGKDENQKGLEDFKKIGEENE